MSGHRRRSSSSHAGRCVHCAAKILPQDQRPAPRHGRKARNEHSQRLRPKRLLPPPLRAVGANFTAPFGGTDIQSKHWLSGVHMSMKNCGEAECVRKLHQCGNIQCGRQWTLHKMPPMLAWGVCGVSTTTLECETVQQWAQGGKYTTNALHRWCCFSICRQHYTYPRPEVFEVLGQRGGLGEAEDLPSPDR